MEQRDKMARLFGHLNKWKTAQHLKILPIFFKTGHTGDSTLICNSDYS